MPIAEELLKPIPSPEVVGQSIAELTNQTFDRLSGRLAIIASDPRRSTGSKGTIILDERNGRLWDGGDYGSVAIKIADRSSRAATAQALEEYFPFMDAYRSPWKSHYKLLEEAKVGSVRGPIRYQPIGQLLVLHALRDRYPRGDTDARDSLMVPRDDYSKYPPEDWGERHKIGVEVASFFEDALAPNRRTMWRFGMFLQNRFDKPAPQRETISTFDGLVDTKDISYKGEFKPIIKDRKTASYVDVEELSTIFATAKDLRPVVTNIAKLLRSQNAVQEMYRAFREGRPLPTSQN